MDLVGPLTIGRSVESGLQIPDLQVSRRHALVQPMPEGAVLRDLGSGNGTYIGTQRITETRLKHGDVLHIGPVSIRFEMPDAEAALPQAGQSVVFSQGEDNQVEAARADNVYRTFFERAGGGGAAEQLREAQGRLQAVYEATQIISSERDLKALFARIMDQLFKLVPAHNGLILLRNPASGHLSTEFVKAGVSQSEVVISQSIVRRALDNGEAVLTFNAAADERFSAGASIIAQNITSAMCVPLEHQDQRLGVLYVDTRGTASAFTHSDLELMVALARAAAIAIRNAQYLAQLEQSYHDTLIVLSNAIEMRDHYTVGHTWRVTRFAIEIGRKLGWDKEKLHECEMGGILHDVGKIAVDDEILRKPGGLTPEEFGKMQIHPQRGARLMQDVEHLVPLIPYALYHHERWDGKGYPYGLAGEEIPVEGRVVAVADTYDAMTSNRPYRKGLDPKVAIEEIRKKSGTQFDPQCVAAFEACYEDGAIHKVLQNYFETDGRSFACPFCSTYVRIPEKVRPDDEMTCNVCHRRILVRYKNDLFFGELLAQTEPQPDSLRTGRDDTINGL